MPAPTSGDNQGRTSRRALSWGARGGYPSQESPQPGSARGNPSQKFAVNGSKVRKAPVGAYESRYGETKQHCETSALPMRPQTGEAGLERIYRAHPVAKNAGCARHVWVVTTASGPDGHRSRRSFGAQAHTGRHLSQDRSGRTAGRACMAPALSHPSPVLAGNRAPTRNPT